MTWTGDTWSDGAPPLGRARHRCPGEPEHLRLHQLRRPQAARFNQSDQLCLSLEDYLLQAADAADFRLSVLTGCAYYGGRTPLRGSRCSSRCAAIHGLA